ncbi:MAG: hypothetical protein WD055_02760 [Candidatus Dependentiae bacterium]
MKRKKKYPEIKPQFLKNAQGKTESVYLDLETYESIFDEIEDLKKKIADYKAKRTKS